MTKIREDLVGSVLLPGGILLRAGDVVPDGVSVGDHIAAAAPVVKPVIPVQETEGTKPESKRRARPSKSEE